MVGGLDRYFQIARCFRDEDLRADRQPEFTQIDIEMSFVSPDDVMELTEGMIRRIWKDVLDINIPKIKKMSYQEAMDRFGTDRPDTRFDLEPQDITETYKNLIFPIKAANSIIISKKYLDGKTFSKSQLKKILEKYNLSDPFIGCCWIKYDADGKLETSLGKSIPTDNIKKVFKAANANIGDMLFIIMFKDHKPDFFDLKVIQEVCLQKSGQLRSDLAQRFNLIDKDKFEFVWVTDFPLLYYDDQSNRLVSVHHPFTSPTDESAAIIDQIVSNNNILEKHNQILNLKAKAYDLVCNGHEIGGGSIRIHQSELQQKLFKLLGLTDQEIQDKFGFFIDALGYGTPPHGGIAMGLDRIAMLLSGTDAIRDVIAFPKTTSATCLMSGAPNKVSEQQLSEIGLEVKK